MTKLAILHPGIYDNPKNDALTTSFLADVTVVRYTDEMTKEELLAAVADLSGLTHVAFVYHYPGHSALPFFVDMPPTSEDASSGVPSKPTYRYFSDRVIDILRTLRSAATEKITVDILSCDLKEAAYTEEVKKVEADLNVNIRYSVDKTGNPASGANWTLESETPAVSVRDVYFTEGVLSWTDVLTGDITAAVKAGTYSAYIAWNSVTKTYTVQQNFNWTTPVPALNNTSFIIMEPNEVFDGASKTINLTGLTNWPGFIVMSPSVTDLSGAPIIKNLTITNGTISGEAGGIIRSYQKFFKLINCHRIGSVAVSTGAGGLVGSRAGTEGRCEIISCSNSTTVSGQNAGGIVGFLAGLGSSTTSGYCLISNCSNTGTISGTNAGGILGANSCNAGYCELVNCSNTGLISGLNAGGIVGTNAGLNFTRSGDGCVITGCSSTANITGSAAGGIAGYRAGVGGRCVISECYVNGTNSGQKSGGIVGSEAGCIGGSCTISNCYKLGNISAIESGGIAGNLAGTGGIGFSGSCVITNCYTIGNITAGGAGGIVGPNAGYNLGFCSISSCYSTGEIGGVRAGGIAGEDAGGGADDVSSCKCEIDNCYSLGEISGEGAGGIAGGGAGMGPTHTCEITNCYSAGSQTGADTGGIVGATSGVDSGSCTIVRSVCNGGSISGDGSIVVQIGSSTVLSIIDGAIYTSWEPSIWLIGEPATVIVNSVPVEYNLPILNGFRLAPWNSDLYLRATDTAQFGISPSPNTFSGCVNPFLSTGTLLVYTQKAIDTLVANGSGTSFTESARVSWAPLGTPAGSLLRDLQRAAIVRVSNTNPLHAYRFQRVQLINGVGSEGVGGSATNKDAWQTGWICVWSADGTAPVFY